MSYNFFRYTYYGVMLAIGVIGLLAVISGTVVGDYDFLGATLTPERRSAIYGMLFATAVSGIFR